MNSDERLSFQKRQHEWLLLFTLLHKENLTETDEYIYLPHPQKRQTATRVTSLIHFKLYGKETDGYIYMEHEQKRVKYKSMESQPSIIDHRY
jgi:hypothetical protein